VLRVVRKENLSMKKTAAALDSTVRSRGKAYRRGIVIKAIFLSHIYLRVASVLPKVAFG
jgi:hypothetical protein